MKKSKVILASGAIFCAALNLTACVYGAPSDYNNETSAQATEVQESNEETEETEETDESAESEES